MTYSTKGYRVSDEVHRSLRIRAAETGETMGDIVERALRRELGMLELTWQDQAGTKKKVSVITYATPSGRSRIDLTPGQVKMFEAAGVWPKAHNGEEYCQVSHGLHSGLPTWTDEEVRGMILART